MTERCLINTNVGRQRFTERQEEITMATVLEDYKVADLSLADFGRRSMTWA